MAAGFEAVSKTGGKITLGIRPENITLHTTPVEGTLPGKLYVTQLLGNEALVMVTVGGHLVSVRMDIDAPLPENERVWLAFDPKRIFFYNAEGNLIK